MIITQPQLHIQVSRLFGQPKMDQFVTPVCDAQVRFLSRTQEFQGRTVSTAVVLAAVFHRKELGRGDQAYTKPRKNSGYP